jgi:hypothetical protein
LASAYPPVRVCLVSRPEAKPCGALLDGDAAYSVVFQQLI